MLLFDSVTGYRRRSMKWFCTCRAHLFKPERKNVLGVIKLFSFYTFWPFLTPGCHWPLLSAWSLPLSTWLHSAYSCHLQWPDPRTRPSLVTRHIHQPRIPTSLSDHLLCSAALTFQLMSFKTSNDLCLSPAFESSRLDSGTLQED